MAAVVAAIAVMIPIERAADDEAAENPAQYRGTRVNRGRRRVLITRIGSRRRLNRRGDHAPEAA